MKVRIAYSVYLKHVAICVVSAEFVSCAVEAEDEVLGAGGCRSLHDRHLRTSALQHFNKSRILNEVDDEQCSFKEAELQAGSMVE